MALGLCRVAKKVKARLRVAGPILDLIFSFEFGVLVVSFLWNNGLREAVVKESFLFLSTFFIQVLLLSYKLLFELSTRIV